MQRDAISLHDIAQRDNLLLATWKAAQGKRQRPEVARFLAGLDGELDTLARAIVDGQAPLGRSREFVIHDPKRRVITAACFQDRVLHHAIMNLAEPRFERMLVESSFACRPGKGVHAAVARVQEHLRKAESCPWLVQVDIAGCFPAIDHALLKALLARRFKGAGLLALLGRIIDAGATPGGGGRGLPIGSLMSQHFANAYLDGADRLLLAHAGVVAHVRYMDDTVWWSPTRQAAAESLQDLREWLWRERRLTLKEGAQPRPARRGLAFCGFRIRAGVVLASSRKLTRYRAGLRRIDAALAAGAASAVQVQRAYAGLHATLAAAQTAGFRRRLHGGA